MKSLENENNSLLVLSIITKLGSKEVQFKPQYQHSLSPQCSKYIYFAIGCDKMFKDQHQGILSLLVIFFILMTFK